MKWRRRKNGSWELRDGEMLRAVIEPARTRGHYWWTTWGEHNPDLAGYAFSRKSAEERLAELGLEATNR